MYMYTLNKKFTFEFVKINNSFSTMHKLKYVYTIRDGSKYLGYSISFYT